MNLIRQLFCSHKVYIDELHRFDDATVVGYCHKCRKPLLASCGLEMPAQLDGRRPLKCEACDGTGVKKP